MKTAGAALGLAIACSILCSANSSFAVAQQPEIVLTGHLAPVLMGVFTPDGDRAITVSSDQTARLWDLDSQKELRRFTGHTGPLFSLALSGDGRMLATGAQDNTIRIWDVPPRKPIVSFAGHDGAVTGLVLSSDGRVLVSVGADKHLRLWDLPAIAASLNASEKPADPDKFSKQLDGHGQPITAVAYRDDGNMIASSDGQGNVFLWSPFLDQPQGLIEGSPVTAIDFHSNNRQIISAGDDTNIQVWQLSAATASVEKSITAHEKPVIDMTLTNGGAQIVSCSADGRVVMSDASSGQSVREFAGLSGEPRTIASRSDNQRIAVGTSEAKVFVWNAGDGELLQTLAVEDAVRAIAWSPDNEKLAVSTDANELFIFARPLPPQSLQPGNELVVQQQTATESPATQVVFDRDSRTLWTGHVDGRVAQWSYASPMQIRQLNAGGQVYGLASSRDGKTIVSCGSDQTIRIWDTTTGQQRFQMRGHQGPVHAVALSPDESFVVSSGADRTLRLWDVVVGRQLKQLATLEETMYSVVIHPNGESVAAAGADRTVYLFNLISGAALHTLHGHTDFIHCVAFNRSGTRLLSYGYAGELRIWDTDSGQLRLDQQVGRIGNDARYNEEGDRILLSNGDGTARVFDVPPEAR